MENTQELQQRIKELEDKLLQLRLSRRVLLHLLERMEQKKTAFLEKLERENRRLHRANQHYAQSLLQKNRQILELKYKLEQRYNSESTER
ncbi:MAG: translation initiation factor 2 [Peptococcaceae bacterium]|nr:translation initiation factor 2 [Peptococcaceae bacterium]